MGYRVCKGKKVRVLTENIVEALQSKLCVEAFVIITIAKGINVLCKTGVEAIKAAEKRLQEMNLTSENL